MELASKNITCFGQLNKCCGISRTFGDRRLAAHLLPGLEHLVVLFCGERLDGGEVVGEEEGVERFGGRYGCLVEVEEGLCASRLSGVEAPRDDPVSGETNYRFKYDVVPTFVAVMRTEEFGDASLADVFQAKVRGDVLECRIPESGEIVQLAEAVARDAQISALRRAGLGGEEDVEVKCPERLRVAIDRALETLGEHLDKAQEYLRREIKDISCVSVMGWILKRIGREAGTVRKVLEQNNISWGCFFDHGDLHNNSHPNNFIILPPSPSSSAILAPLDFDMAFHKDEMFNFFTGDLEDIQDQWDTSLDNERTEMRRNLAGSTFSTGLAGVPDGAGLPKPFQVIKTILRDTLVQSYDSALQNIPEKNLRFHSPQSPHLKMCVDAFITLALVVTYGIKS